MAVMLRVRVVPRARSNRLTRDARGGLRARVTAPPVEDAANRALVDLVARALGVKRGDVEIVHGARGRDKVVAVHAHSEAEVTRKVQALATSDVDNAGRHG
jgi:uncharacterized protein